VSAWPALARSHLAIRGPVVSRAGTLLFEAVAREVAPGHQITLDLSDITSIDGTQAVLACRDVAERHGAELIAEDPGPIVRHALRGAARSQFRTRRPGETLYGALRAVRAPTGSPL
jgi:hypothetical protein